MMPAAANTPSKLIRTMNSTAITEITASHYEKNGNQNQNFSAELIRFTNRGVRKAQE